ncbi:Hsp33 family molecular chaperone HslO [Seongchinamella sediminis]|uniref:Hsp33 family molecular chaperone HslO n=1 Tax=Seongchinamella sediminis TaxID=2283635 RepID=A0A3L7DY75_9GAMM|nr:Hsp33 family molecular chaperone HslO [Seongchinamella sediminis]RLQ20802.1 Hsp33 family molecular chaperone HslO [Seongchinamella sediminis]
MPTDTQPGRNRTQRFLFEDADIRGEIVHLDDCLGEITAIHQYAPGVNRLLGEFLAAAVLLATTLKFEGRLVLQARSQGQIPLLMAECDNDLNLRAIARGAQQATSDRFDQLLAGGQLAITVDPSSGRRYQGIVPLVGDSLAHSLDAYFRQSEQLGTRLWLACDGERAAGMLLQQLPAQRVEDSAQRDAQWEHVNALAATLETGELLQLAAPELVHRLYHEDPLRLFEPVPARFRCNCSRERTLNALSALPQEDIRELLEELGSITMDCEFCNQQYQFVEDDLGAILNIDDPGTLH